MITGVDVGERIREARKKKKLTVEKLAEQAGLSRATVSAIETGNRKYPREESLEKISKVLGINVDRERGVVGTPHRRVTDALWDIGLSRVAINHILGTISLWEFVEQGVPTDAT